MNKKQYLLAAILTMTVSPAFAQQWKHLSTHDASTHCYLNPKTLQVRDGVARAWTKREFEVDAAAMAREKLAPEKYKGKRTVVAYEEFDCAGRRKRVVSGMSYDNERKQQRDLDQTGWREVGAEGVERTLFEAVCREAERVR